MSAIPDKAIDTASRILQDSLDQINEQLEEVTKNDENAQMLLNSHQEILREPSEDVNTNPQRSRTLGF